MRTPKKSLSETAYGMRICFGENGDVNTVSDCEKCPYFECKTCINDLHVDALYYLECYRKLLVFVKHPEHITLLSECLQRYFSNAPSDEELDRMYDEYMEDKKNAENHVL